MRTNRPVVNTNLDCSNGVLEAEQGKSQKLLLHLHFAETPEHFIR